MKRLLAALGVVVALAVLAPAAMAHPLGNFSINHLSTVKVSDDRVDVLYVLDKAEIPTSADAGKTRAELIAGIQAELREKLEPRGRRAAGGAATAGTEAVLPRGTGGPRDHPARAAVAGRECPSRPESR